MKPDLDPAGPERAQNPPLPQFGQFKACEAGRGGRLMMVCPTARDVRELSRIAEGRGMSIVYHHYAGAELESLVADEPGQPEIHDPRAEIAALVHHCQAERVDAVASTDDYPGSTLAAIAAHHLHLPGVRPGVNLSCQHKFLSRRIQKQAASHAVPAFSLIDVRPDVGAPHLKFPVFVKPVKSYLSQGAHRVENAKELRAMQKRWLGRARFFEIFDVLLRSYANCSLGYSFLIAEDCLAGQQVTLDGYAYHGEIFVTGIVDSIMFAGTLAFKRFEYPSALPEDVQLRMAQAAIAVMKTAGYDNGQFNIEFTYDRDTDRIAIIEINPRMSSQFADLYEKVDGTNSYEIMTDLALGRQPRPRKGQGRYPFAASCVMRTFRNQYVRRVPDPGEIQTVCALYPDIRVEILAEAGMKLSQQLQDGRSYRYGLLNIGGRDRRGVLDNFADCMKRLSFVMDPV